ncbi:MAG: TIGR03364 family FAD-dependent oxidoreductase [Cyclobacteriaceae bacterium]|nr:TIGR03364 family FAD-dependent oxidoreductase [Cyclobacteriaceae bacterium]
MDKSADVAIVGAGIVGLAHAYMALRKGLKVVMFEREQFAIGASVRNFGMVWPIGQEPSGGLDRALRSREHWREIVAQASIWCNQNGSLHLAYADDEQAVLEEFVALYRHAGYQCGLISPAEALRRSPAIRKEGLRAALWSETEMVVYSREAIRQIPLWLEEKYGLILRFGHVVTDITLPLVRSSKEIWKVDRVVICSGADFETLYPHDFEKQTLTKCKLQMMKAVLKQPASFGPSLCAGTTLRHYAAFSKCKSLKKLDERLDIEEPKLKEHGIHILVSQNSTNEVIIGDSHHYFKSVEPFDSEEVNELILRYFEKFVTADYHITERWNGTYPKVPGSLHIILEPESRVQIVNGLSGAGMTLSFGLAEEIVSAW